MRIQPIEDSQNDAVFPKQPPQPASKSRLRRLFDRPFRRENDAVVAVQPPEFEPTSLWLDKMVRNFIEGSVSINDRAAKAGKNRCNCFNGNGNDSSDGEDEFDSFFDSVKPNSLSASDWSDALKSLIPCATVVERNLLAETSKIVDKVGKNSNRKVAEGLKALGYGASLCVSKWEKSSSIPAGVYEYIDVVIGGDRLIVDVDFRSEFEVARPTASFKQILQSLPSVFVGKPDRLLQVVSIASEAARQSLRKKGMHVAPWRQAEYMKAKWLGPYTRKPAAAPSSSSLRIDDNTSNAVVGKEEEAVEDKTTSGGGAGETDVVTWQLPAVRYRSLDRAVVATGLASMFK